MFCEENLLDLPLSLTRAFIFSMVSSESEIHSSISCILLVMLVSEVSVRLPRFSIASQPSAYDFFIDSISVFKS